MEGFVRRWLRPRVLTGATGVRSRSNGGPIVLQTLIRAGEPDTTKLPGELPSMEVDGDRGAMLSL
jgi:hypothetical protein